jgi:hypothetical protein
MCLVKKAVDYLKKTGMERKNVRTVPKRINFEEGGGGGLINGSRISATSSYTWGKLVNKENSLFILKLES